MLSGSFHFGVTMYSKGVEQTAKSEEKKAYKQVGTFKSTFGQERVLSIE